MFIEQYLTRIGKILQSLAASYAASASSWEWQLRPIIQLEALYLSYRAVLELICAVMPCGHAGDDVDECMSSVCRVHFGNHVMKPHCFTFQTATVDILISVRLSNLRRSHSPGTA